MNENMREAIVGATPDELSLCIQLLSLNVVQHREKRGFVAFSKSMSELRSGANGTEKTGLLEQGAELLEEALEMARILLAESAAAPITEEATDEAPSEKRNQLRISVAAPVKVLWDGDSDPVNAKLEDISWGGAAFHVDQAKVEDGDKLQIILPDTKGSSISIDAKILRTWDLPDGRGQAVATRFVSLSTEDEKELENILELLAHSKDSGGHRQHARLIQRLDIEFDGEQEFRTTLNDISAGGLGVTVPESLQIGQSLQAVISTLDGSHSLKLRARVVRQNTQKFGNVDVYQVGLKFEHPSDELNELTNSLLQQKSSVINPGNQPEASSDPVDIVDKWWV